MQLAIAGGQPVVTVDQAPFLKWPLISEVTIEKVAEMLRQGVISQIHGGVLEEFETRFRQFTGAAYALVQNNGTSTLHSAYVAAGVGPGDEVLVPTYTWGTSVSTILAAGGTPVFCDIDPDTLCIDPADMERKVTPRTRAICVVHMWGNVADMDSIMALARAHHLVVVEDCSHAHGAAYKGCKVGTIGDIGCYSLQGSKAMPGGELGVVITNNRKYYDRLVVVGHQGRVQLLAEADDYKDCLFGLGFKYRAHPLAVALALDALGNLPQVNDTRQRMFTRLDAGLSRLPGIRTTQVRDGVQRGGYYGYRCRYVGTGAASPSRKMVMQALQAEGVLVADERYLLIHRVYPFDGSCDLNHAGRILDAAIRRRPAQPVRLPVAEYVYPQLLALPVFNTWVPELVEEYVAAFEKVFAQLDYLASLETESPTA